jgi:hypothetical protein
VFHAVRRFGRLVFFALAVAIMPSCDTHRPRTADAAPVPLPIELRAAHGELVASLRARGGGRFTVLPLGGSPLEVQSVPEALTVTREGAVVLLLRAGPTGFVGERVRLAVPEDRSYLRILDDIGVTLFAAEPRPGGGTVGRDRSGTPILEALAQGDRLVVDGPSGGVRLATVHGVAVGPQQTLVAAVLAAPDVPLEARAAAVALLLSR